MAFKVNNSPEQVQEVFLHAHTRNHVIRGRRMRML